MARKQNIFLFPKPIAQVLCKLPEAVFVKHLRYLCVIKPKTMKNFISTAVLAASLFAACSDSTEPASKDNSMAQATVPSVTDTPTQAPPVINNGTLNAPLAPNAAPVTPAQSASTEQGMNPPHGQPGHRCDIAVGAPLNSPPAAPAPAPTTPASGSSTPFSVTPMAPVNAPPPAPSASPSPTPVVTPPGMNPPHGQPGHDCAIAVGAPLKKQTDTTGHK